jgi:hypothetical protein
MGLLTPVAFLTTPPLFAPSPSSSLPLVILFLTGRYLTGMVEKRTLEKYEREAKEKNRETW